MTIPKRTVADEPTVFIIDDDPAVRDALGNLVRSVGLNAAVFGTTGDFLRSDRPNAPACLVLDVRLPNVSGLDFQGELENLGVSLPIVFITGHADVPMSVRAMKGGAVEFLCKPFREQDLLDAVQLAMERDRERRAEGQLALQLQVLHDSLTPREKEVMGLVVSGLMNKQVAGRLGVSEITIKVHRANVMRKMGARSLAALVRMADALTAGSRR
jgi:FixJ family two-component response regulator